MELLIQELRQQRDAQLRHFEALDARAGILLGFAGAIAIFSPRDVGLGIAGRSLAILAAMLALASFVPRGFPLFRASAITNVLDVHERTMQEQRLVERLTWTIERAGRVLRSKSRALALAVTSIVAATALLGGAIILTGGAR